MSARDDYYVGDVGDAIIVELDRNDYETMCDEIDRLRRQIEFMEIMCDGGKIEVNGIPWREAFDRLNTIVSDPV